MKADGSIVAAQRGLIVVVLLLVAVQATATTLIEEVRLREAPDHTRVVFDLSASARYELFTLTDPHRVVIDIADARGRFDLAEVALQGTVIQAIRSAPREGGAYRIVLDLDQALEPDAFALEPAAPHGHRLVVDLHGAGRGRAPSVTRPPQGEDRDIVIAIDAGHGGEDPGAIGVGRVYEKEVVLEIARELERLLDAEEGFRGELIRTGDYYISLRERTARARETRADLFLSIHADAFHNPLARGASVYTLSAQGATSETARWLAERENRADLIGGVGDVTLMNKDDRLASVLLDLSMDASRSASIAVGEAVLVRMGELTRLHKSRVEQAGFVVLKSPDIPSILVETGYLSNPDEARRLSSERHQRALAQAIFDGLTDYLYTQPPPGTLVARRIKEGGRRYVIERGDTLSEIAARYNVSARRLRQVNELTDDTIRIGQVLVIPTI